MGEHDAPVNWLDYWRQAEPLRLYLYGITVPLLGAALVYGWLTTEQLGAWLAVAAALFAGSTAAGELARRKVSSPLYVDELLHEQHRVSYANGVQDALHITPDEVAEQHLETTDMQQVRPAERCRHIENGRRCVLDAHGKGTPHHYG